MKKVLPILALFFALISCSHIYFQEVQPKKGIYQTEMPEELFGVWFGSTEGWQMNEYGITNIDLKTDSLNNVIDTVYRTTPLSDSVQFFKATDLYVLNARENSNYWEIMIFQAMDSGDIHVYSISDPKVFYGIKGLELESANYYIDDELRRVKTLEPEATSSLKFQSAVFSGQMKIRSLKRVLKSIPPTVLSCDSTIYEAE